MGARLSRSTKLKKSNFTSDSSPTDCTIMRRQAMHHSRSVCEIELKDFSPIEENVIETTISSKRYSFADSRPRYLSMAGLKAIEREEKFKKQEEGLVRNTKKSSQVYNRNLANRRNNEKNSEQSDILVHAQALSEGSKKPDEAGLRALEREKKRKRDKEIEARKIYKEKHDKITR